MTIVSGVFHCFPEYAEIMISEMLLIEFTKYLKLESLKIAFVTEGPKMTEIREGLSK